MRTIVIAALITLLTVPAYAQGMGGGGAGGGMGGGRSGGGGKGTKTSATDPAAEAKKKADEKAFNDAVKQIPTPQGKHDPWGGVR